MSSLERYYKAKYERFRELLKWRDQLKSLVAATKELIPDAGIYVFGSAINDKLTANSDIDILIVSDKISNQNRHKLAAAIEEKLANQLIFELHLTARNGASWYRKHAKEITPAEEILVKHEAAKQARSTKTT